MLEVVAAGRVGEMSGRRTNAARNTMSDWDTTGRVLVEARVGTLCMGIMRLLGGLFLPQAKSSRADAVARCSVRERLEACVVIVIKDI